jgi:predicted nucleotidyltransferase component of viral defense system
LQLIRFDITNDEVVADTPIRRAVNHPYEDEPSPAPEVLCYSVNEILAEKSRALYERQGRARDLHDVVHIARVFRESVDVEAANRTVRQKFAFKRCLSQRPT